MSEPSILSTLDDAGVLTLTMNRPKARNALDLGAQSLLLENLREAAYDPGVRVVVLTGSGGAFSAGGDVGSFGGVDPDDPLARKWAGTERWGELEMRVDRLRRFVVLSEFLHGMGKPTIAMIRGAAAGAGMSFALACDFRIGAPGAFFLSAFARIGVSGDFGGSYFLTRLVGPAKAKEIYMLSDRINAEEALRLGLLTRLVDDAALESETYAFAARLAKGPPVAYRYMKENINAALTGDLPRVLDLETRNMIRCIKSEDGREAAKAFLEKREPQFKGW
ncbi:MAG: enoyl-CoA hydratase-related protein [Gammaproteobacteria bacterium]